MCSTSVLVLLFPINTCNVCSQVHVQLLCLVHLKVTSVIFDSYCVQVADALNDQLVIDDIDSQEADNPQLCSEYAKDIYRYLRKLEVSTR